VTIARLISAPLRSGLIIAAGTALIVLPFIVGLSASAIVTGIAVGALAVALGVAGTAVEGRGTLPATAHAVYDRGLAFGLVLAGVLLGLAGDVPALALFGGVGIATLGISAVTTYSHPASTV
jgi:hypothetical protein